MNGGAIGVFDSGLGGLTTVRQLHRLMPEERIIYFGDTGRVPYGSRSREILRKYAQQDMAFLMHHQVKMVIAACGTVSSTSADLGAQLPVPFTGIIEPAARAAVQATRSGRIGVIATAATIASEALPRAIRALMPTADVRQQACPLFVPLVEGGFTDPADPVTRMVAERYLAPLRGAVDTLILACTHYPIIAPIIGEVIGDGVTLIDSGAETARHALRVLESAGLRADPAAPGGTEYYVTDRVQDFERIGGLFLGQQLTGDVHHVDVDQL